MIDITPDDILTWDIQLEREGTLPPEVQRALLKIVKREVARLLPSSAQRASLLVPA